MTSRSEIRARADARRLRCPSIFSKEHAPMKMMLGAVLLAIVVVVGAIGYSLFRTPAQASAPIEAAPIAQTGASAATTETVFDIDPSASSARFVVDEVLRGSPKTVIGT